MIDANKFIKFLENKGINFFTGVPDSLMMSFCNLVENKKKIVTLTVTKVSQYL